MSLIGEGAGGHSPAWHGAAPGAATEGNAGQANSGIKSKEILRTDAWGGLRAARGVLLSTYGLRPAGERIRQRP